MTRKSTVEFISIEDARRNLGRITVLAITVSQYIHLKRLPGTAKDFELVRNIFFGSEQSLYKHNQFIGLRNPTIQQVREALLKYADSRSASGDVLIFYFSGHGCITSPGNFGFCLADTIVRKGAGLPLSVLSFRDVVHTLSTVDVCPIFIIDACFSASTASTYVPGFDELMEEQLQARLSGSYGLMCSSNPDAPSDDLDDGGAFTKALHAIVTGGLSGNQQRHWPFLTISNLAFPLQERLAHEGHPLPRRHLGPDLPEIPIAWNAKFKPQLISFTPQMKKIIRYVWNNGNPREVTVDKLSKFGKGAYANHSKLSLPPWKLLRDGKNGRTRRLTVKGKLFAKGKISIPERIIKDRTTLSSWVAAPQTRYVLIRDVGKPKVRSKTKKARNIKPTAPRSSNIVFYGDNLQVLQSLKSESIRLIYIDPPFNTGKIQSRTQTKVLRDENGDRSGFKNQRYKTVLIGQQAFPDSFDDYQGFLKERLVEAYRLLTPDGSLYLHLDYREVHNCKILLDQIFGRRECFLNEIIWAYDYGARTTKRWPAKHDNILWYVKDPENYIFNYEEIERIPYMAPGLVGPEKAARGKTPTDTWWHTIVSPTGKEKTGYPTQKPLGVLKRIVQASSNPGDTVLDFFAGSGTTGEAAFQLGRKFILIDDNPEALDVMRQRLAHVPDLQIINFSG